MNINLLISFVLILISFGIGASLTFSDFFTFLKKPKALILGLFSQILLLPLISIFLLSFFDIDPLYKFGFILLSLCPGGSTSNFISHLLNLEAALSILLTSINSFIILLTLPLGIKLASFYYLGDQFSQVVTFSDTGLQVLLIIVIPAILGILFKNKWEILAEKVQRILKLLNLVLLFAVFAIKFFAKKEDGGGGIASEDIGILLPPALIIHVLAMVLALLISQSVLKRKLTSITISVEVGLQNTTLALLIAGGFSELAIAKPALVYAIFSFFTTFGIAYLSKKYNKLEK